MASQRQRFCPDLGGLLRGFVFAGELPVSLGATEGAGDAAGALGACGERAAPDWDWTSEMSELLIEPLTVTSTRKLSAVTSKPD